MTDVPQSWIDLAHRLADIARPIAKSYFRRPLDIIAKGDASPVTVADRSIEAALREEIERTFPDHGILGEEHGSVRLDGPAVWVLDPIDGTRAFITGMPTFGTLIAACVDGRPVLGVIDQPIQEERWIAATGHPCTFQGAECHPSAVTTVAEARLYSTAPDMFADHPSYHTLADAVRYPRFGGDCYAYGLLATGHVDLVVEAGLQPYDYCALTPIIEGAGGKITDWNGARLTLDSDGKVCAAGTEALHAEALSILNG